MTPEREQEHLRQEQDPTISFDEVLGVARRQGWLAASIGVLGAALGLAYALTATPQYTASAKVLIDNSSAQLNQLNPFGDPMQDNATVLSQVELIKSDKVVASVVERFGLAEGGGGQQAEPGLIKKALDWISLAFSLRGGREEATAPLAADPAAAKARAMTRTARQLNVKRLGMTYILDIQVTDESAPLASQLANGFAEAYIEEQISVRAQAATQARVWLRNRIEELTSEARRADLAVQQFRAQNQMISIDGRRVDEQQLTELNTQLSMAIGRSAEADAKFNRIESIIASGDVRSLVTEALGSSIITELRQKYLAVDKQASELEDLVGPEHARVSLLREEMRRYEAQIFEELQRIRESARSEREIALLNQADLERTVAGMSTVSAKNNEVLVELKSLEDKASTARAMLQTLLQRDQEAQQGQSFAMSEARVISPASVPQLPSFPKKQLFLLAGLLLGLAAGAGLGFLREMADRSFRNGRQIERLLGLPLIGAVPLISSQARAGKALTLSMPGKVAEQDPLELDHPGRMVDYSVNAPMSSFAEALRSIKLAIDLTSSKSGGHVIGFTSSEANEGKSTLSKNFTSLLALSGFRVLLVDGDLRSHGLTRYIDRSNQLGLVEVLEGRCSLQNAIREEPASGLDLILTSVNRRIYNSSELISSKAMSDLLDKLRGNYDYIILDLPPMGPVVDAKAVAPELDGLVMIVEWGVTRRYHVQQLLESQRPIYDRCVGVVFNKIDPQKIHHYDYYGSYYYGYYRYNYSRYKNYYVEEGSVGKQARRRGLASWLGIGRGSRSSRGSHATPSRGELVLGRRRDEPAAGSGSNTER